MRGQWGYVAISAMLGIATAYSHFAISYIFVCGMYLFLLWLKKLPWLICVISFAFMCIYTNQIEKGNVSHLSPSVTSMEGAIQAAPLIDGDKLTLTMQARQEQLRLSYIISSPEEKKSLERLQAGTICTFGGEVKEPSPVRNFYAFDYKEYLHRQQIHYVFIASSISSCHSTSSSFSQWLFSIRQSAVSYVQHTFPKETVGFMNALIYGDRQDLSSDVERQYQEMGLIHLLAISGSHISVLIAGCYYLLLRLGSTRETATVLLVVLVPLYMFLAGASPSVVRASVAAVLVLACFLFTKRISGIDVLSMTALLMLLYDPYVLFDIGFQYSFLTTFALILSAHAIFSEEKGFFRNTMNVALIAQLISFPVTLYYFGQFSPYSLVLNLVYVPFLSFLILPLCLVVLFLSVLFPIVSQWLASLLAFLLHISNELLRICEELPLQKLTFGQAPMWLALLYVCIIVVLCIAWEGRVWRRYVPLFSSVLLLVSIGHYIAPYFQAYGKVMFVDVGQGDCIVIDLPYRKGTYLIDTGGTISLPRKDWQKRKQEFSVGKDTLIPYLRNAGIKKIDKLIVTHGDQDHVGAAEEVLKALPVREMVIGQKDEYSKLEKTLMQIAAEKQIQVQAVKSGDRWNVEESVFTVLSPFGDETKSNDQSIVLQGEIGGLTWLFTADLEESGERRLVEQYPHLRSDVLKMGHHGSKTSSSSLFLETIQPRVAVISVGLNNRYGHPHQEVIERLQERNMQIWRTDEMGAVSYTFRAQQGTFQSKLTYDENTSTTEQKK
ncbi:DNA internalization-related competence protein ComEC/Rec2 [Microbacteriaceae bacterium 4G12]